jgi:hypothetical protein
MHVVPRDAGGPGAEDSTPGTGTKANRSAELIHEAHGPQAYGVTPIVYQNAMPASDVTDGVAASRAARPGGRLVPSKAGGVSGSAFYAGRAAGKYRAHANADVADCPDCGEIRAHSAGTVPGCPGCGTT